MSLRPLRIATTNQLAHSVRKAGFDAYVLPDPPAPDIQRGMHRRLNDGEIYRPFLEKHDIELVVDFNTGALTFSRSKNNEGQSALTTAQLGIPYVSCLLDPITSVMREMRWDQRWHILENPNWFKGISDQAHGEELARMGIPGLLNLPIAAGDDDFDTRPLPAPDPGPVVSFMGHPATTFFRSNIAKTPDDLYPGILAAAVQADMPDLPFHKIYYDLYRQADPPAATDDPMVRAKKSGEYFDAKFMYNLFLAVKQRDRFACFLKAKLGDNFELIGDFWKRDLGLEHTPRIWDMKLLHERMRKVPICLNLSKGCAETGLNLRHFEITAHGGFMLTYPLAELESSFVVGQECDVFHNEEELLEKIAYYLEHPKERTEIALAGQRRTLSEHLGSHRIGSLVAMLRQQGILSAPVSSPSYARKEAISAPRLDQLPQGTSGGAMFAPRNSG